MRSPSLSRLAQLLGGACTAMACVAASAATVTVYSNTFEAAPTVSPGVTAALGGAGGTASSEGYSAYGFGSTYLRNATGGNPAASTTLTLSGLPAHSTLSIGFLLAVIDSWDETGGCGPDVFNVRLDGVSVFAAAFDNVRNGACGPHSQTYGTSNALLFPTAANIDFSGSSTSVAVSGWNDAAYDMSLESLLQGIAHTASTATIEFFASGVGWQAGDDESWAVDNVAITLADAPIGVSEPAGVALAGLALAALGAASRRRSARR
jgi:hypothetical protein